MKRVKQILFGLVLILSTSLKGNTQVVEVENFFVNNVNVIAAGDNKIWTGTKSHGIVVRNYEGDIIQTLNTSDGLLSNKINSLIIDNEGRKWIGTAEGLNLYENNQWSSFTKTDGLASNEINSLLRTGEDSIWIGTSNGLSFYDGSNFHNYTTSDGLVNNFVTDLAFDNGNIYVATIMGLMVFDGVEFTEVSDPEQFSSAWINSVTVGIYGALWFGTNMGAVQYAGDEWEYFDTENGLLSNEVQDIMMKDGKAYILTNGGGIGVYDNEELSAFTTENSDLPVNNFKTITLDEEQNIWVGYYKGVSKFDGENWNDFSEICDNHVNASATECGNIWLATDNGIAKRSKQGWNTYNIYDGLISNHAYDIQIENGGVWIATDKGITHMGEERTVSYTEYDGLVSEMVQCVAIDSSYNKWFGTDAGISVFNGTEWTNYTVNDGLSSNKINDIKVDQDGIVWIATDSGVNRYSEISKSIGTTFQIFNTENGLASDTVNSIQINEDNLWFGTNQGISVYDGNAFYTINMDNGLTSMNVTSFAQRDTSIWVGTDQGIEIFNGESWTVINSDNGLFNEHINDLTDCENFIWVATNDGLAKVNYFVNHAPTSIQAETSQIPENIKEGEIVTTLQASDPDDEQNFVFTLVEDSATDNELFTIRNNQLIANEVVDYEVKTEYHLQLKVEDQYGASKIQNISLDVQDLQPVLEYNALSLHENPEQGKELGTAGLSDEGDMSSVAFEIIEGNTENAFGIDPGTGLIMVNNPEVVDYETNPDFMLSVTVTDGKNSDTANVYVEVLDIVLEGYNVVFVVYDEKGNTLSNAKISLEGYATLSTLSNGQVVFGNVTPTENLFYSVDKEGYKQDSGKINVVDENIIERITLKEEDDDQNSDSTQTAIHNIRKEDINVFPNPASTYVRANIDMELQGKNTSLIIRRMNGTIAEQRKVTDHSRINVSHLSQGTYIFEFVFENQSPVYKKIVIR